MEVLKEFGNRTDVVVAKNLVSEQNSWNQMKIANPIENQINFFKRPKVGDFFCNDDGIQVNELFTKRQTKKSRLIPDWDSCNIRVQRIN